MDETEFFAKSQELFSEIENRVESLEADAEVVVAGNVLTIECEAGDIVINRHTPTRQIWLATRQGGLHFEREGTHWRSTRTKEDFWSALDKKFGEMKLISPKA